MAEKRKKTNSAGTVIMAVLMFGGMLGFFYVKYLWVPFSERREKAEKQMAQIEGDIAKALVMTKKIDQLNAALAALREREKEAESRLPRGKQLPDMVRGITAMAGESGVSVSRITPMQGAKMPFYSRSAYGLNASGAFYDVYRFIAQLAVSERIYTIENLRLNGEAGQKVSVSFTLVAYDYGA